eukprot:TRINITY_DN4295_c0_g1_i2.p1 TRINITY_DN4295_c0_g1~~TRINITY_DN4295_c0_g1_i2.p1  ORF type:complete len:326 (-),score=62.06 TRINITY_DN4295_c0_g1_i2:19-996(-)
MRRNICGWHSRHEENTTTTTTAPNMLKGVFFLFFVLFYVVSSGDVKVYSLSQPDYAPNFLETSRNYVRAAYSAYCKPQAILSKKCYWCTRKDVSDEPFYQATHFFAGGSGNTTFGWAGYSDSEIIFSFRGTIPSQLANWITNFGIQLRVPFKAEIPNAKVHVGFLNAYLLIEKDVIQAGIDLTKRFPNRRIIITGHSLGGALATLAAADIAIHPKTSEDVRLWTFGSPRVGNTGFAAYMNTKYLQSYRIVNNRDVVPSIPGTFLGYVHINKEYFFTAPTIYRACNNATLTTEDLSCSDAYKLRTSIWDHTSYLGVQLNEGNSKGC